MKYPCCPPMYVGKFVLYVTNPNIMEVEIANIRHLKVIDQKIKRQIKDYTNREWMCSLNNEELAAFLEGHLTEGDKVLIKGSNGMKLSEGEFIRYKHLDYTHLEDLLIKNRNK